MQLINRQLARWP